ncbi:MAG: D-glycero-beta-D-manno-heptose 1-phosphate adenylyltransferase, partial [Phycisphaeraceae bacterium]|nr:D-glycero-beta-D-manno-heptose 1-phosphate adenylyltransferase [Phycisphaeraceae bacterium]
GLEVERFGTVPIDLDEIMLELLQRRHAPNGKVRTLDQLLPELRAHRKRARTIVFTNGCFDILHAGHISYLRQARRHGDLMVVAVNSDASIRRIKGAGRPVNSAADRLMVLSELESIDYLVEFDENTPMKLIRSIRPDVLVKGGDYKRSEVVGGDWVRRHGGRIELVDLIRGRSTTNVIRQIRK